MTGSKSGLTLGKLALLVIIGAVLWSGILGGALYAVGYQHGLQVQRRANALKGNFKMVKMGKQYQIFERKED
jgi:hypothetical protein